MMVNYCGGIYFFIKIFNTLKLMYNIKFLKVKIVSTFILTTLLSSLGFTQYNYDNIPKELLTEEAKIVVRKSHTKIEVVSLKQVNYSATWAYTILNEQADDYFSSLYAHYDDFSKVKSIEGKLYDKNGNIIKKLKKNDIVDVSPYDGMSLAHDNRLKWAKLKYSTYPYTVEFTVEKSYEATFFVPDWSPQFSPDMAIQEASFELISKNTLRIKQINIPNQEDTIEKLKNKSWKIQNITAKKVEPLSPSWSLQSPNIFVAPTQFEIDGYIGSLETWEDFGKWGLMLNENRQELPTELKTELQNLVADAPNDYEKIRRIYKYLQDNTRYVSIQLGIGGWQPFEAQFVAEKKYGDCKALSNFTRAMLKAVDIESHYAFIGAGRYRADLMKDFPSNQFNHAVLCVPMKNKQDTVWLECTSQTEAFAYQGGFTDDRDALLITPEGGKLVHTTVYKAEDNKIDRKANINLKEDGTATATVTTKYGALQEERRSFLVEDTKEEQTKFLYENLPLNNVEIIESEMIRHKERIPFVEENLKLEIRNAAKRTGKRLFIKPNLFTDENYVPDNKDERTQPFVLRIDWIDTDTIQFSLPEGFSPEAVPQEKVIESEFGSYSAKYIMNENGLTYIRKMEMKKGTFPKEQYKDFISFMEEVKEADQAKIVLADKT